MKLVSSHLAVKISIIITLFATVGCATVSRQRNVITEEGAEIPGTSSFALRIGGVSSVASGTNETVFIKSDRIARKYDVERFETVEEVVERKRFLSVAGVHPEYSVGNDLLFDPIMGTIMAFCSPVILPLIIIPAPGAPSSADSHTTYGQQVWHGVAWIGSGIIGILPLVCYDFGGVSETSTSRHHGRSADPGHKEVSVPSDAICGQIIDWRVSLDNGAKVGEGEMRWPDPIQLPYCDWVLQHPEAKELQLTLASKTIALTGNAQLSIPANLLDAVKRRWPDTERAPRVRANVLSTSLIGDDGKPLTVLRAGKSASLRVFVRNEASGSADTFAIKPIVSTSSDALQLKESGQIGVLRCGQTASLDIHLFAPLGTKDETTELRVRLVDVLQRECATTMTPLIIRHADVPELWIRTATLWPMPTGSSTHEIDLHIENRGSAPANNVRIELEKLPRGLTILEHPAPIASIPSNQGVHTRVPVRLSNSQGPVSLTVRASESLGLDPAQRHLTVVPADLDSRTGQ